MGLEGGKWGGRVGVWLPWAGWCSFSFCFLLWYGGCALFLGVLYLSIFGVSVCGAPGLAFVGLGARVCFGGFVGLCLSVWWVGVYRRVRMMCIDWCLVGVFWFPFLGVCVAINCGLCFWVSP